MRSALLTILLAAASLAAQTTPASTAVPPAPASKWPVQDRLFVAKDFRFGTGEALPELKLRYLTLGKPHRDSAGHVDNAAGGRGTVDRLAGASEPGTAGIRIA